MLAFLLANWKAIVPSIAAIGLGLALGVAKFQLANERLEVANLKESYAEASAKAVTEAKTLQAEADAIALKAAMQEAVAQQKVVVQTITLTHEVPKYVATVAACPTTGFMHIYQAALLGSAADQVSGASSHTNDDPPGITTPQLAENIVTNYGACRANAEQLKALQDWVRKTAALTP